MLTLTNAGLQKILADLTDNTAAGNHTGFAHGLKALLFQQNAGPPPSNPNITADTVLGDLTQANFTGYAESTAIVFGAPYKNAEANWEIAGDLKMFVATDGVSPNTVIGWGLVMPGTPDVLYGAEIFATPKQISGAGSGFPLVPKITLPTADWGNADILD